MGFLYLGQLISPVGWDKSRRWMLRPYAHSILQRWPRQECILRQDLGWSTVAPLTTCVWSSTSYNIPKEKLNSENWILVYRLCQTRAALGHDSSIQNVVSMIWYCELRINYDYDFDFNYYNVLFNLGCTPRSCQHGGSCVDQRNGFKCNCFGFTGIRCETGNSCWSNSITNHVFEVINRTVGFMWMFCRKR